MKSMTYTVLESHAYDNVLIINYFCTTTNFSRTYVRMHLQWFVGTCVVLAGSNQTNTVIIIITAIVNGFWWMKSWLQRLIQNLVKHLRWRSCENSLKRSLQIFDHEIFLWSLNITIIKILCCIRKDSWIKMFDFAITAMFPLTIRISLK